MMNICECRQISLYETWRKIYTFLLCYDYLPKKISQSHLNVTGAIIYIMNKIV